MNDNVTIKDTKILSDKKYVLKEISFQLKEGIAAGKVQKKEVYERKNSTVLLLFNKESGTVILTQQFRLPTYLNGNESGILIECCAGVMEEGEDPETCIRREALEETGYRVAQVEKIMESYTSPASVTELIHFFIAPYTPDMKVSDGGGLAEEQEHIEVLELPFKEAYAMIAGGKIQDAKTIILLQYLLLQKLL